MPTQFDGSFKKLQMAIQKKNDASGILSVIRSKLGDADSQLDRLCTRRYKEGDLTITDQVLEEARAKLRMLERLCDIGMNQLIEAGEEVDNVLRECLLECQQTSE